MQMLGAFGLIHGGHEWIEMWGLIRGTEINDIFILIASYVLLYEFGISLLLISKGKTTERQSPGSKKPRSPPHRKFVRR